MDISNKKTINILLVMVLLTTISATLIVHAELQTTISFEDKTIPRGSTKNVGLYIDNVSYLGSFDVRISWDPAIIDLVSVSGNDGFEVVSYIKNDDGSANLTAITLGNVTGSIQPTIFKVKAIGSVGESCILRLVYSELLTADPSPDEISHTKDHGLITVDEPSSSGGDGGGGLPAPPANTPPVCDASSSETIGFVGEQIQFDGSESYDPDGSIISYSWDFGDGETGIGIIVSHQYEKQGNYEASLTVKDDGGASASDILIVNIQSSANNPPTMPMITGPNTGSQNQTYSFTFESSDDDGDDIRFLINWGDNTSNVTEFSEENTAVELSHQWKNAGRFLITAQTDDNMTVSSISNHVILIDAIEINIDNEMIGVITDVDEDTIYDRFNNHADQISYDEDSNNYLLDTDGDSTWDYTYDVESDEISTYEEDNDEQPTADISWLIIIGVIVTLVIIGIGIYLMQSKQKKK